MSVIIERIENVGPHARARRLVFDDYSTTRVTSAAAVKLLGLEAGDTLEPAALEARLAEHEPRLARERALQLLGYRERSASELTQRLLECGYPRSLVETVVSRYCEVELVDDRRFAAAFVRSRAGAGYGKRRILRELAEKGVAEDVALAALEAEELDAEADRALEALRGRRPRDAKDRERLVRRLVSRGFELRDALDAVGPSDADSAPGD